MIVRLMGEGQYRVDDDLREELNRLDETALEALEAEDETGSMRSWRRWRSSSEPRLGASAGGSPPVLMRSFRPRT